MSKKDKTLYTEHSITSETPREFTRRVPSTYLGSALKNTNLIKEIFANSIDEAVLGHGDRINVSIDTKKNVYMVEDFGQGFLVNAGIDKQGKTILQRCFDTINTSGKTSEDGVYSGTSLGLNGIGAKLTNWLSLNLNVITYRDGKSEEINFKDGLFIDRKVKDTKHTSGTKVTWSPDPQFFKVNEPDIEGLKNYFEELSALCPYLTINLNYNGKEFIFTEPDGLNALMNKRVKGKELFSNRFIIERQVGKDKINMCLTYTSDYSESINAYVNLGHTDGGAHFSALRTAFTKAINKYANDSNLLKKNDKNFTGAEIAEGLNVIFNITTTTAKYDAQNKSRIDDIDVTIINQVMSGDFATWLTKNTSEAKIIIERAINARKAKEAAQKAKERVRETGKKAKKFIDLPTKLIDAYSKKRQDCDLYIVEGDSAANGIVAKKNGETQAVFPIRGKVISCRKQTANKVFANQEIANIVKALGLESDKVTGKLVYDVKRLRYGRIIFATDADEDGADIRMLLLTAFAWLCPELIQNGHIYVALPPLFRITDSKNNYIYLKDNIELEEYKEKHKNEKFLVNRMKGLGEMSPDELEYCLLDPTTRNVPQLIPEDYEKMDELLEIFKGPAVEPRRDYLFNQEAN